LEAKNVIIVLVPQEKDFQRARHKPSSHDRFFNYFTGAMNAKPHTRWQQQAIALLMMAMMVSAEVITTPSEFAFSSRVSNISYRIFRRIVFKH
jgi:hypothetical protein